jgi:hypothetical protein
LGRYLEAGQTLITQAQVERRFSTGDLNFLRTAEGVKYNSHPEHSAQITAQKRRKFAIIEDEEDLATIDSSLLQRLGHETIFIESGESELADGRGN